MSRRLTGPLRWAGFFLSIAACGWVAHGVWKQHQTSILIWPNLAAVLTAAVACFVAMLCLGLGWSVLLRAMDPTTSLVQGIRAYALSQPGKYLPGNVAHFAVRHWMGRSAGLSHAQLAFASLLESTVLIATALILAGLTPPRGAAWAAWSHLPLAWIGSTAGIAVLLAAAVYNGRVRAIAHTLAYSTCALMYFVLTTFALATLLGPSASLETAMAPTALSWAAGFLVLGAPGGIGIRETVLIQMLEKSEPASLTAVVIAFRLTLMAADLSIYALAVMWPKYPSSGGTEATTRDLPPASQAAPPSLDQ